MSRCIKAWPATVACPPETGCAIATGEPALCTQLGGVKGEERGAGLYREKWGDDQWEGLKGYGIWDF